MPENNLEEFEIRKGATLTITLKGLATAGYEWNYKIEGNKDCLKILKDFDTDKKLKQKSGGDSVDEIFLITGEKPGVASIHFTQQRSWEKNTDPVNKKKVKIVVG